MANPVAGLDVKEYMTNTYMLGYKILIPFLTEIKEFLRYDKMFTYSDDEVISQVIVRVDDTSINTVKEKRPIVSLKRSALERDRSVLGNAGKNMDPLDDNFNYGEVIRTNVNITVSGSKMIHCEALANIIFYYFDYNKDILRSHGITDAYFKYMSAAMPVEGATKADIETWQIGINVAVTVHENILLQPFRQPSAVREFELFIEKAFLEEQFTAVAQ